MSLGDGKTQITIEFDTSALRGYTDERLAFLWHLAQANPANGFTDEAPGEIVRRIGWEIIRRWLKAAPVELYHHQPQHYFWEQLRHLGKWVDGVFVPGATVVDGKVVMPPDAKPEAVYAPAAEAMAGSVADVVESTAGDGGAVTR